MNWRRFSFSASAMALAVAGAQASVVFNFNDLVAGVTPAGSPPWATLTITNAGVNTVDMTLSHSASSAAGQFISTLWLNMDPYPGSPAIVESSSKITGASFTMNGEQNAGLIFDMRVDFETSNSGGGVNRLKPGESVNWQITGTGLTESAFQALSQGDQARFAMIHMQGLPNGESGKIAPVPEPTTIAGLALALGALVSRRRKRG